MPEKRNRHPSHTPKIKMRQPKSAHKNANFRLSPNKSNRKEFNQSISRRICVFYKFILIDFPIMDKKIPFEKSLSLFDLFGKFIIAQKSRNVKMKNQSFAEHLSLTIAISW